MIVVIVVDCSLSMCQRTATGVSLFDLAKWGAEAVVKLLQSRYGPDCKFILLRETDAFTVDGLSLIREVHKLQHTPFFNLEARLKALSNVIGRPTVHAWKPAIVNPCVAFFFTDGASPLLGTLPSDFPCDYKLVYVELNTVGGTVNDSPLRRVADSTGGLVVQAATFKSLQQQLGVLATMPIGPVLAVHFEGEVECKTISNLFMTLQLVDTSHTGNWFIPDSRFDAPGKNCPTVHLQKFDNFDGTIPASLPFDQYQLLPQPHLNQEFLTKLKQAEVWKVTLCKCSTEFGFIKMQGGNANLYLLPYNFTTLLPLLAQFSANRAHVGLGWQRDFSLYLRSLPVEWHVPLHKALHPVLHNLLDPLTIGQKPLVDNHFHIAEYVPPFTKPKVPPSFLELGLDNLERSALVMQLEKLRLHVLTFQPLADKPHAHNAQDASPLGYTSVLSNSSSELELFHAHSIQRQGTQHLAFLTHTHKSILEEEATHCLPVQAMGNYIPALQRKLEPAYRELRNVHSDASEDPFFINFGNRYKRKRKRKDKDKDKPAEAAASEAAVQLGVDEADVQAGFIPDGALLPAPPPSDGVCLVSSPMGPALSAEALLGVCSQADPLPQAKRSKRSAADVAPVDFVPPAALAEQGTEVIGTVPKPNGDAAAQGIVGPGPACPPGQPPVNPYVETPVAPLRGQSPRPPPEHAPSALSQAVAPPSGALGEYLQHVNFYRGSQAARAAVRRALCHGPAPAGAARLQTELRRMHGTAEQKARYLSQLREEVVALRLPTKAGAIALQEIATALHLSTEER